MSRFELLALKKKRTSTSSEEERTKVPRKNASPNQLKPKKRKPKKSEEKPTTTCKAPKTKKKAKFVTPIEPKSTSTSSNKSNVSEDSLDKDTEDGSTIRKIHLKKLSLDTSTDSSIDECTPDIDNSKHDRSTDEEIATTKDPKESSAKKKPTALKPKKNKTDKVGKDVSLSKDSTKNKVSVVKPKKFEMTLAVSEKTKATSEKKIKIFKKRSSTVISGKENGGASPTECGKHRSFFPRR